MDHALIVVPFASVLLLNLPFWRIPKRVAFWCCALVAVLQILLVARLDYGIWNVGFGMGEYDLLVDPLSRLMLLCIGLVSLATMFVALELINDERRLFNFLNLLLIAMAGMNGVVTVRGLFSLYLFTEITAVASLVMIAFDKDRLAFEGAYKYLLLSAIAAVLMLAGIALLLMVSGSTDFTVVQQAIRSTSNGYIARIAASLFLCGLFIKAGVVPFHAWVPDVYSSASASTSVFLAGIVTKVGGIYSLMRVVTGVFGAGAPMTQILLCIGGVSVVLGAVSTYGQNDVKRMLAYSSISQVGYIILGLGCGTPIGLVGAAFHLFNHAVAKTLLFVNSASLERQVGSREMGAMSGLASRMPITGWTSVVASLSTAGMPPLPGFWSKLIIVIALWMSGHQVYSVIAVLASVLTLGYFLSFQRRVFFGKPQAGAERIVESGPGLVLPALALAAITVAVGLWFPAMLEHWFIPVTKILAGT
jgi:multicomponent Na+:H+ antiporter subunit D